MATSGDIRALSEISPKGLPHNDLGEVEPAVYRSFLDAIRQGTAAAFENVTLGGNTKLVNPSRASHSTSKGPTHTNW
jgi:hypothetical protein